MQHARNVMEKPIGTDLASAHGSTRDLFQIFAFMAMEPPTALDPAPIGEEKNKIIRSMLPIDPTHRVRDQSDGYRGEDGVDPESETETCIALKCFIDNWRWAGVRSSCAPASAWPKASGSSPSPSASRRKACSQPAPASARRAPIT